MEVEFDTAALRAVIDQAQGDDIYIDVRQIETASLEKSQQKAVQDKVVLFSFSASVMSGDTVISQFYDGSATIRIPFEPEDGIDTSEYAIVYLTTDGEIEVMDSTYEDGYLIFSTSHFSEYAIVRDASLASDDRNGAGYVRWCLPVVLLAAVCGIVLVVLKRKKS
jgi:hypothetical protein